MTNAATLALLPTVVTPTTTGRLGIETATPGSVLDVNGNAAFRSTVSAAGTVIANTLTSNTAISIGGASVGSYDLTVVGGILGTAANDTMPLAIMTTVTGTGNTDDLEIMNIRNASGGTTWTTAGMRLQQRVDSTYMGWIGFNNGNTTATNNGGISFGTGTSNLGPNGVGEKMRLDANGRLGIGVTAPGSLLQVNGTITGSGTDTVSSFNAAPTTMANTSYNYVISGNNDTGNKLVCFVNGSNRAVDGGANGVTIRNDAGPFNLGLQSYVSNLYGNVINIDSTVSVNLYSPNVNSSGLINVNASGLSAGVRYYNTVAARDYRIIQKDAGYLSITDETAGAERLNITSAGVMTANMNVNGNGFYINADTLNRFTQGAFILRSGSPTIYFRDTDQMSAMLHCNSNLLYILRGGIDTETWTAIGGQWPAYWDLSNNNCVFGGAASAIGEITAYASDRRLKENIKNIPDALNKVLQLNGVSFSWMDKTKDVGFCVPRKDDVGVIAQEVQKVLPEAVRFAPFDRDEKGNSRSGEDYLTVQYEKLTALLIEAVKDQQAMIDGLKSRISALESKLADK